MAPSSLPFSCRAARWEISQQFQSLASSITRGGALAAAALLALESVDTDGAELGVFISGSEDERCEKRQLNRFLLPFLSLPGSALPADIYGAS